MSTENSNEFNKEKTEAKCELEEEQFGKCEIVNEMSDKNEVDNGTSGKCEVDNETSDKYEVDTGIRAKYEVDNGTRGKYEVDNRKSDSVENSSKKRVMVLSILGVIAFIIMIIALFSDESAPSSTSGPGYVIVPEAVEVPEDWDGSNTDYDGGGGVQTISGQEYVVTDGSDNLNNTDFDEGISSVTTIIIGGEDVSDAFLSNGNSVVIVGNNLSFANNNSVAHVYNINNQYDKLDVENAFEVIVSDTASRITIMANESFMPEVVMEGGNKLIIRNKSSNINGLAKVTIPYNPNLTSVFLSGASKFHSDYALEGRHVKVDASGASGFYCNINAVDVDLQLTGNSVTSGNVTATELSLDMGGSSVTNLTGQIGTLKISLKGSSNMGAKTVGNNYALTCDNINGSMSGSSAAYIHCDRNINVNLSGASTLHYSGDAITSGSTTSSASSIIHY